MSEKDAMSVLDIIRGEYDVDDNRKCLIGISAGGAGAFHLGVKYADQWTPVAPAAFHV